MAPELHDSGHAQRLGQRNLLGRGGLDKSDFRGMPPMAELGRGVL